MRMRIALSGKLRKWGSSSFRGTGFVYKRALLLLDAPTPPPAKLPPPATLPPPPFNAGDFRRADDAADEDDAGAALFVDVEDNDADTAEAASFKIDEQPMLLVVLQFAVLPDGGVGGGCGTTW